MYFGMNWFGGVVLYLFLLLELLGFWLNFKVKELKEVVLFFKISFKLLIFFFVLLKEVGVVVESKMCWEFVEFVIIILFFNLIVL